MSKKEPMNDNPWLRRFAALTALVTFLLIGLGGLVTSHGAGMSVPDWPNSYGYNMFFFPIKDWVGGIFYEHTHRLLASAVGLMTTILAVWLWVKDPRRWMRWLGVIAFFGVVAQGVLGGLRVVLIDAHLGIVHAIVGQLFFVLMGSIALFTSRWWRERENMESPTSNSEHGSFSNAGGARPLEVRRPAFDVRCLQPLRRLILAATLLIFCQLVIGATMRQAHAGLSIPDFPLAYGRLWPDTSAAAVAGYNAHRISAVAENPITAFQIVLQMLHRIVALLILISVAACAWLAGREEAPLHRRIARFWLALILVQIGLGAWTIWSNKAADVATLHVMGGALALMTGAMWCLVVFRRPAASPLVEPSGTFSGALKARPTLAANK